LSSSLSPIDGGNDPAGDAADADPHADTREEIVAQARRALGLPYVWGGGGAKGPTGGGFDCSGLTQFAVAQATNGQIILPRTTYDQIRLGQPVDLSHARPGDLVFSNFSRRGPEHVQIFAGHTPAGVPMVIEAQQTGVPVKFSPLSGPTHIRRLF
jgi:cell wall-associated NlpC family hydrolase